MAPVLRTMRIFALMSDSQVKQISLICQLVDAAPSDSLCTKGCHSKAAWILMTGKIKKKGKGLTADEDPSRRSFSAVVAERIAAGVEDPKARVARLSKSRESHLG